MSKEEHAVVALSVTGIVALLCIVIIVVGLNPSTTTQKISSTKGDTVVGQATASGCVPVVGFDYHSLDFNKDGRIDYYDYDDVLSGKVDCSLQDCDLNDDGVLDARDKTAFDGLVLRLYDYNNDGKITREDERFLGQILANKASCDSDHVCDLTGDGQLCSDDLAIFTSLFYNYDS